MEKFLRDWRQDALNKHQYESAVFVGDKLLALTSECFSRLGPYPTHPCVQTTTRTLSGWPRSTSLQATTRAP